MSLKEWRGKWRVRKEEGQKYTYRGYRIIKVLTRWEILKETDRTGSEKTLTAALDEIDRKMKGEF